jgi:hypothetical protein
MYHHALQMGAVKSPDPPDRAERAAPARRRRRLWSIPRPSPEPSSVFLRNSVEDAHYSALDRRG